jgi:hypothetical protein
LEEKPLGFGRKPYGLKAKPHRVWRKSPIGFGRVWRTSPIGMEEKPIQLGRKSP